MSEFAEFLAPEQCQACPKLCAINGLMRRSEQKLRDRLIEGAKLVGEPGKRFDNFVDRTHPCSSDEFKSGIRRAQAAKIQLAEDRLNSYREKAEQLVSDCPGLMPEVSAHDTGALLQNGCQSPHIGIGVEEFSDFIINLENSEPPEYY